jgi:hypothetical protein
MAAGTAMATVTVMVCIICHVFHMHVCVCVCVCSIHNICSARYLNILNDMCVLICVNIYSRGRALYQQVSTSINIRDKDMCTHLITARHYALMCACVCVCVCVCVCTQGGCQTNQIRVYTQNIN